MKLMILTHAYPSLENLYANAFVHRRVLEYINQGNEVNVFVYGKDKNIKEYSYEGVNVVSGNNENFVKFIEQFSPDAILVHFISSNMIKSITNLQNNIPVIVWIHGFEALGWYRRMFYINRNLKSLASFLIYIIKNNIQMISLRKYINKNNAKFIFVSNWMKSITEKDTLTKIKNYEIIPNIIDDKLFKYEEKLVEYRKNILLIRPFISRKYATDLAIDAIVELSKRPIFKKLQFTIIGDGIFFDEDTNKVKQFSNVKCIRKFLTQSEIYEYHNKNGIFLCPTRQDSQGVSMCEAMSSGLVPIASDNTAIPEFVKDCENGLLTSNSKEIADKIELIYNDKDLFKHLSLNASKSIREKCSYEATVIKELKVIKSYITNE